jgi:hypothetical protein
MTYDRAAIMREAWANAKFYKVGADKARSYLAHYMRQAWAIARAELRVRRWAEGRRDAR